MTENYQLQSVGGQPCTAELAAVFQQACALPAPAISGLWELLDLAIMDPIPDDLNSRVAAMCKLYDLAPEKVTTPVQGIAFLLNAAAGHDLAPASFAADLQNLCPEGSPLIETLMSGYPRAIRSIREGLLRDTLFDHGSVLTGLDWRLDAMLASQRGMQFNSRVAVFTMRYREGGVDGTDQHKTLYVTPQVLADLRRTCEFVESLMAGGKTPPATPPVSS